MEISRAKRLEGVNPAHKLDCLQFASEFHFELIAENDAVGSSDRKSLQRSSGHRVRVRRVEPERGDCDRRLEDSVKTVRVAGPQYRGGDSLDRGSVPEVAV